MSPPVLLPTPVGLLSIILLCCESLSYFFFSISVQLLTPQQFKLRCLNRTAINPAICSCYIAGVFIGSCTLSDVPPVARDPSLASQEMRANAKPAAAPRDGVPGSEYPALIKMSNQHTRLSRARTANPPKLDVQHNTQAMPVRAHHGCRAVP